MSCVSVIGRYNLASFNLPFSNGFSFQYHLKKIDKVNKVHSKTSGLQDYCKLPISLVPAVSDIPPYCWNAFAEYFLRNINQFITLGIFEDNIRLSSLPLTLSGIFSTSGNISYQTKSINLNINTTNSFFTNTSTFETGTYQDPFVPWK